jgi:hypothetical protein
MCLFVLYFSYIPRSFDHGPPEYSCEYCSAIFWYAECLHRESSLLQRRVMYSGCCSRGSVSLPIHHPFLEPLHSLVRFDGDRRCSDFMHLIPQYTSLFTFTSIGVHIDQLINTSSRPCVFCINGVVHHRIGSLLPVDGSSWNMLSFTSTIRAMRSKTTFL